MLDWKQIEEQWPQLAFQVKATWIKLTDEDITAVAGDRDLLVRKVQERYALVRYDAEKRVNQWFTKVCLAGGKAAAARAAAGNPNRAAAPSRPMGVRAAPLAATAGADAALRKDPP